MSWTEYLRGFHDERPGITAAVLRHGGGDPYRWLLEVVPPRGRVLDLACGDAPLWADLAGRPYVGIDVSEGELAAARDAGAGPLVRASGTAIPLATASVDVVVCSMSLMVLTPVARALAEIGRVLVPGGVLAATVPARGPLRPADLPVVAGLMAALGRGLTYPGDAALRRPHALFRDAGLRLESDERRRFGYPLGRPEDADRFLDSLYVPGLHGFRYRTARGYLRALARTRAEAPIPVRRIVARRTGPPVR